MGYEIINYKYKLLYIGWINNKVLLYSIGNYIQYLEISHNGKEYVKERVHRIMYKMCTKEYVQ